MKLQEHPPGAQLSVIDNPDVSETYVDHLTGILFANGIMSLTLSTLRADASKPDAPQFRQVVARLTMPAGTAKEMAQTLQGFITQIEASGGAVPAPGPGATVQ